MSNLNFLKSFLTEDLYILKEDEVITPTEVKTELPVEVKEYDKTEEIINQTNVKEPEEEIKYKTMPSHKGSFNKKILITVQDDENEFINDSDLGFLLKILGAVKLSLEDVAIINISKNEIVPTDFSNWSVVHYISFTGEINTPNNSSLYSPVPVNKIQYLNCNKLSQIAEDKGKKQQLWTALQRLFLK